jgi:hypothetical protein
MIEQLQARGAEIGRKAAIKTGAVLIENFGADSSLLHPYGFRTNPPLTEEGERAWNELMNDIANLRKTEPSKHADVNTGYEIHIDEKSLANLDNIDPNRGLIVMANHSSEGPKRGWTQMILINSLFREATGEELIWVQGYGYSCMNIVHKALGETVGSAYVDNRKEEGDKQIRGKKFWFVPGKLPEQRSPKGTISLLRGLLKGSPYALFPEGDQGKILKEGNPTAGHLALTAAEKNIQIVCASISYRDKKFSVVINNIDPETIKGLKSDEARIKHIMEVMASGLPEDRRGPYPILTTEITRVPNIPQTLITET